MNASSSPMIVCGLFQGSDSSIPNDPGEDGLVMQLPMIMIKALVATEVRIDNFCHTQLLAAGFNDAFPCREPSAKLLPIASDVTSKLSFSGNEAQFEKCVRVVEQKLFPLPYKQWTSLIGTDELIARIRQQAARHNLSSAYVEVVLTSLTESIYGGYLQKYCHNRRQPLEPLIKQALHKKNWQRSIPTLFQRESYLQTSPSPIWEQGRYEVKCDQDQSYAQHLNSLARTSNNPRFAAYRPSYRGQRKLKILLLSGCPQTHPTRATAAGVGRATQSRQPQ
jgi:hypothetical protein